MDLYAFWRSTICMKAKTGLFVQSTTPKTHISFCGALPSGTSACVWREINQFAQTASCTGVQIKAALQTSRKKF
jgi:hypothetical protein